MKLSFFNRLSRVLGVALSIALLSLQASSEFGADYGKRTSESFRQSVGQFHAIERGDTLQQPSTGGEEPTSVRPESRTASCAYGNRPVVDIGAGHDLVGQYNSAIWSNGLGQVLQPQCDDQEHIRESGYARYVELTQLEDGSYSRAIAVHPNWVGENTFVRGTYGPFVSTRPFAVEGKFGFRRHWERSKDGAIFSVIIRDEKTAKEIKIFEKHHEEIGQLRRFSSRILDIQDPFYLILTVDAGETTIHDWAAWVDVRVVETHEEE